MSNQTKYLSIVLLCIVLLWVSVYPCLSAYQTVIENSMHVKYNPQKRVRFTQMWSTGHVGTQFLTGLLASPDFFDKNCTAGYITWNEYELPLTKPSESIYNLSLDEFKAMMAFQNSRRPSRVK